ncbi:sensor histidine kinase [Dellaglioa sp. L3N]
MLNVTPLQMLLFDFEAIILLSLFQYLLSQDVQKTPKVKVKMIIDILIFPIICGVIGNIGYFIYIMGTLTFYSCMNSKPLPMYHALNTSLIAFVVYMIIANFETFLFKILYEFRFKTNIKELTDTDPGIHFFLVIGLGVAAWGGLRLIKQRLSKKRNLDSIYLEKLSFYDFIGIISLISLIIFSARYLKIQFEFIGVIILVLVIVIGAILLMTYFVFDSYTKRMTLENKLQVQQIHQTYIDQIEQRNKELRRFKHDYQNILLTLEHYIQNDDREELRRYFHEVVKESGNQIKMDSTGFETIARVQNEQIKLMMYNKIIAAQNQAIKVHLEVDTEFEFTMAGVDAIRVLGILFDNAIEALIDLPEEHRFLNIALVRYQDFDEVIMQNEFDQILTERINFFDSSSKGEGRGQGLKIIRETMAKYEGSQFVVRINGNQFEANVILKREA